MNHDQLVPGQLLDAVFFLQLAHRMRSRELRHEARARIYVALGCPLGPTGRGCAAWWQYGTWTTGN